MDTATIQLNTERTTAERPLPHPVPAVMPAGPRRSWYTAYGKRLADVTIAALLTVLLLSWMIPVLFLLICLGSRGPLFFVQLRSGRGGMQFPCIKFRTMRLSRDSETQQASADDQRVTRVGRILRRTHIDELPQLINVLLNQMSLVGPRPHMLYHDQQFASLVPQYTQRFALKPGITGLAQASGYHGATPDLISISHRTKLDLFYCRKLSAGLDVKILMRTLLTIPAKLFHHARINSR